MVWLICSASSRVGAMIRARTWLSGPLVRRCRMGSTKAAVLPVPVWARPSTSLPVEDDGDGLFLDGGGRGVAGALDARDDARVERKLVKIHYRVLLDS